MPGREDLSRARADKGWKGVGQRDVQLLECRTCAFRSYSDHMAETGSRLEQPVSSGRVLSRFRGSLRTEPPSSSDHGGLTRGQVASPNAISSFLTRLARGTRVLSRSRFLREERDPLGLINFDSSSSRSRFKRGNMIIEGRNLARNRIWFRNDWLL